MLFSVLLLLVIFFLAYRASPRERAEDAHIHGAGQIGLLAAVALFGVDYFTSFFYATGEMMSALHPYGLQKYAYLVVGVIAFANFVFGVLYMYSLGVFNEGGGSYTASMRYLKPTLSLIVAITLIEDYVLTIVVSALSGGDQLLSILNAYGTHWFWHFALGAILALVTWYLTIRGRGESAKVVFTLLGHICFTYCYNGDWPSDCTFQGRAADAAYRSTQVSNTMPGVHAYADSIDERYGSPYRPGSHVERHPVREE